MGAPAKAPQSMAGLTYVNFNQDKSLLAVATTRGLRIYSTDPFELQNSSYEDEISLVEQLFSTSLVAMVLTPRLLRIVNTKVGGRLIVPVVLTLDCARGA